MSGQEFQSASIKEAMKGHFGSLQEEIDKNNALQGQLLRVQQEILEKQQQVLDRLAIMQSRIQAVLTQTYELHEYPIPRLFIVLPKFRLFFLCECGAHTKTERSRISHEIHLAKHEGYDVDRPTEFFEKYGSYVLTMMQMLKYGFAAAGIVVPPLAHFKLSDGIEALQENLNLAHKSIGPLVDGTISYIESQKGDDIDGLRVTADRAELNNLEVMEGADLRQLESYLSIRDKGRVLGNLYRVVTTDGNVKWVCIDHYRENYRESVMQHLRDIVAANNGIFTEEKGKIDIKIASGTLAKQFYEAMAKARRIQELDITLQWDVTLDDLRKFAVAVGNANILHLTMDGVNFKGPPLDTINRGRRYDPILQLMSNGRIQSLNLKNFKDFYQRVGSTAFAAAPRLRILSIDAKVSAVEQHSTSTQAKILKTCPRLDELSIESDNFSNMFLVLTSKTSTLQDLKVLTIRWMDSFVTTTLSQGKIRTVVLGISFSSPVFESAWDLIQRGHLTTLTVQDTPKESDNVRMEDILRRNSKLSEIKMVCYGKRAVEITRLITSMREKIISEGGACSLTKVELSDNSWNDDIVKTTVEFSENTIVPKISTSVRMLSYVPRDKSDRLAHLFRERGWSIGDLETDWSFGDNLAAILEESSKGGNSKLTSLALDPRSLTSDGLDRKGTEVACTTREGAELRDIGERVDRPLDAKVCERPSRRCLPELDTLRLFCPDKPQVAHDCAQWIAAMVSAPPQLPQPQTTTPSSQLPPGALSSDVSSSAAETWKSLQDISLKGVQLEPEDWKVVLETLDFTALEKMSFEDTNFSLEQLEVFVNAVPDGTSLESPLKVVQLGHTPLVKHDDAPVLQALYVKLEKKAPLAKIEGLWQLD
ncbi:hypothetical protein EDD21DRAFT_423449 [Dissophora ornata]|nr:hypothetical protein EDD21DRAFT_423449 [Dissophora ornata]